MSNPFENFTKKEWLLWIVSVVIVTASNLLSKDISVLNLSAALIGVTSLVFAALGNAWSQLLMIVFSCLYGIISWQFKYWGEMITYLGMTLPMAVFSMISWIKNPSENKNEVEIQKLDKYKITAVFVSSIFITGIFCFILYRLNTPNMLFSTISIWTSFVAAALTMLRSPYYAMGYAANDLVLIVLWVYASMQDTTYFTVAVNFAIFFLNDIYGFINWKKREKSRSYAGVTL